jgi:endonuclease/exonuclease/phosphatase family metal-dependent hydrolase
VTRHPGIVVRVLTWNLFHGRDAPPDRALFTWRSKLLRRTERNATHVQVNRPLRDQFTAWLAARSWEIALLQEAPPRWLSHLARESGASGALGLTSRNELARIRGLLADLNPDLLASEEGGSNQLLVRAPARIVETRRLTVTERPEHRVMLWTRVEAPGGRELCVANLHATADDPLRAAGDVERAAVRAVEWAGDRPLILGGDLNVRPGRHPAVFDLLRDRFMLAPPTGPESLDHLLGRGLTLVEAPRALPAEEREVPGPGGLAIRLSDHAPVVASFGMR